MANIMVRKNGGEQQGLAREIEPARWIRDFFGWDPFREMTPFLAAEPRLARFAPDFEVKETKDGFQFKADMPGVKDADIEITVTGNRLNVAGKRESEKEEKSDTYYVSERTYGAFARAFTLPDGVDTQHMRAELKEGVLTIALPKLPEMQPRKIEVKTGEAKKS